MSNVPPLKTRQPTGKPSWPIVLIAGAEKAGKTYSAALASASELVGRTLWVGVGEDDPDEYGAIPGARFEIVEHDGTYRGILAALTAAAAQPRVDGKPNLLVMDSATRAWELLVDEQQVVANQRAARKAERSNRPAPDEDATITMDQWNAAKQRWANLIDAMRGHDGPSVVTARLEQVTVLDGKGNPTSEKSWKVKAEKSLPYDVGAVVQMPTRGEAYLTGVRSLRFVAEPDARVEYRDFTVEKLWADLGLAEADGTSPRRHSGIDPANSADGKSPADRARLELAAWLDSKGIPREKAVERFRTEAGGDLAKEEDAGVIQNFTMAWQDVETAPNVLQPPEDIPARGAKVTDLDKAEAKRQGITEEQARQNRLETQRAARDLLGTKADGSNRTGEPAVTREQSTAPSDDLWTTGSPDAA